MALFSWTERKPWGGAQIGDRRVVARFLMLPKCLSGEWRWLGVERITQEHARWLSFNPSFSGPIRVRGWRNIAWTDREESE